VTEKARGYCVCLMSAMWLQTDRSSRPICTLGPSLQAGGAELHKDGAFGFTTTDLDKNKHDS